MSLHAVTGTAIFTVHCTCVCSGAILLIGVASSIMTLPLLSARKLMESTDAWVMLVRARVWLQPFRLNALASHVAVCNWIWHP